MRRVTLSSHENISVLPRFGNYSDVDISINIVYNP